MPYVIDTIKAGSIDTQSLTVNEIPISLVNNMVEVDNTFFYSNSTVLSSFKKTGKLITPDENLNVFTLKSKMQILENDSIYFVLLGTLFSDTEIKINNFKGSFNNVPDFFGGIISTPYSYGGLVEDAESPGNVYTIDFTGVSIIQIGPNEYFIIALFYTANPGDNFIADVNLDVELTSESEITFSNVVDVPIL